MADGEDSAAGPYDPEFYDKEQHPSGLAEPMTTYPFSPDRPDLTYEPESSAPRGIVTRPPGAHVARAGELIPDDRRVLEAVTSAALDRLASLRTLHLESKAAVEKDIDAALARTRGFADAAIKALGEVSRDEVFTAVGAFFTDELARLR